MNLTAKLAFLSVPSDAPPKTRAFFEKLLGINLVPALSNEEAYHAPISEDGIDVNVTKRHSPQEQVTAFFAVENLQTTIAQVQQSGGKVVWGPEQLDIPAPDFAYYQDALNQVQSLKASSSHLATAVIVVEPGGTQIGLLQLADHAQSHYKVGHHYQPLTPFQMLVHNTSMQAATKAGK